MMPEILGESPVRVVFGAGTLRQVGALARETGASRVLLVTDAGVSAAGHVDTAVTHLRGAGLHVVVFDGARENPTAEETDAGVRVARPAKVDFIMALGGGSAMDCAKGINLILTSGGEIRDYCGEGRATKPMLPSIAVPTTAGTGSEAQSFALIGDPVTHRKMACGDRRLPSEGGLRPRIAILDPDLTRTASRRVTAAAGCQLLGRVEIGDQPGVGANAVVIGSLPGRCVAGGVPARVLRSGLSDAEFAVYWDGLKG